MKMPIERKSDENERNALEFQLENNPHINYTSANEPTTFISMIKCPCPTLHSLTLRRTAWMMHRGEWHVGPIDVDEENSFDFRQFPFITLSPTKNPQIINSTKTPNSINYFVELKFWASSNQLLSVSLLKFVQKSKQHVAISGRLCVF